MKPIVPAIIPTSTEELELILPRLQFSPEIHIDVTDGRFVPNESWPYNEGVKPKLVKSYTDKYTLEVDLMVEAPLKDAELWLEAGADMLVFHIETVSLNELMDFASETKVSIGVCALNDTSFSKLEPFLTIADYVQVMGIAKIGAQGQPFDERVFQRIDEVKDAFPDLMVSIDGSVNKNSISKLAKSKADRFICGSAIVKAIDPQEAYESLRSLIN